MGAVTIQTYDDIGGVLIDRGPIEYFMRLTGRFPEGWREAESEEIAWKLNTFFGIGIPPR